MHLRRSLLALFGISVVVLLFSPAAYADSYSFTFAGSGFTGSGTFTTSATATPGQFLIDSVNGTTDGIPIQGILPPGTYPPTSSGNFPNDNLFFYPLLAGGALDLNGFAYSLTSGSNFDIFHFEGYYLETGPNFDSFTLDSFSIIDTTTGTPIVGSPVPEPGSLLLLATGVLGIAGTVRRRSVV